MFILEKQKPNWALVRRNGFLKCEVILRSSLLSSVKIFDGSSECAVFQNLVPEVYVQQLSLQAFINQKLLSLKKDASTSFLLVCSGVTGHRLPIEPIWTNFSIQRGQRTSERTRLTSNKRSVMWTAPLFSTNMLSWGYAQKDHQLTCRLFINHKTANWFSLSTVSMGWEKLSLQFHTSGWSFICITTLQTSGFKFKSTSRLNVCCNFIGQNQTPTMQLVGKSCQKKSKLP